MPIRIFADTGNWILKLIKKGQQTRKTKITLKRKNKVGGITLPNFKTYYKATIIKWHGIGEGSDTQINRAEKRAQK